MPPGHVGALDTDGIAVGEARGVTEDLDVVVGCDARGEDDGTTVGLDTRVVMVGEAEAQLETEVELENDV